MRVLRVLIVGGFEESGHDQRSRALAEEGADRGHVVREWRWRDQLPIDAHPVFHLHRIGVQHGAPHLSGLLYYPGLPAALERDLAKHLPVSSADVVVSTHSWSMAISSRALEMAKSNALLVDCHGDFTPGPAAVSPRVDAYVGAIISRSLPLPARNRIWLTGPPVRESFSRGVPGVQRHNFLTVIGGASSWFIEEIAPVVQLLADATRPDRVLVLSKNPDSIARWKAVLRLPAALEAEYIAGREDISDLLLQSRWLVTKASGAAVAEGLACGCRVICIPSGVFWEDEARAHLAANGAVAAIDRSMPVAEVRRILSGIKELHPIGDLCRKAASAIWDVIESGCPIKDSPREEIAALSKIAELLDDGNLHGLEHTGIALKSGIRAWGGRVDWG